MIFFFLETDPENFWEIDLSFVLTSPVKAFEPISLPSLKAALSRTDLVTPRCKSRVHISKSRICHCVTMSPCNQTSYINHFASFMFLINIRDILIVGDLRASSWIAFVWLWQINGLKYQDLDERVPNASRVDSTAAWLDTWPSKYVIASTPTIQFQDDHNICLFKVTTLIDMFHCLKTHISSNDRSQL